MSVMRCVTALVGGLEEVSQPLVVRHSCVLLAPMLRMAGRLRMKTAQFVKPSHTLGRQTALSPVMAQLLMNVKSWLTCTMPVVAVSGRITTTG